VVGVAVSETPVDPVDLLAELVDQHHRGADVPAPGLGDLEPLEQPPALCPEQVADRAGPAEADRGRVDAVLEHRAVLDQVKAKAGELALLSDPGIGKPDRRHQVALGERRQDQRVDLVGLAGERGEALELLGVGDLDLPALLLERVVDQAGTGHRLDHGADGLPVDLVDAPGEPAQGVGVRRCCQLV
jgi:hypothetical protein